MNIPGGNRVVAFARVTSPISSDRSNILIGRGLVQQLRQHGRITDVSADDLDRLSFHGFLVGTYVYLAPTSWDHAAHDPVGQWMRSLGPPAAL